MFSMSDAVITLGFLCLEAIFCNLVFASDFSSSSIQDCSHGQRVSPSFRICDLKWISLMTIQIFRICEKCFGHEPVLGYKHVNERRKNGMLKKIRRWKKALKTAAILLRVLLQWQRHGWNIRYSLYTCHHLYISVAC